MNIDFVIAPSARKQILRLVDDLKRMKGKSDIIPAILWIDAQKNRNIRSSGPTIGFYDNRDEIADDISVIEGFEFVLAIPPEYEPIFDKKAMHYVDESFVLKDQAMLN